MLFNIVELNEPVYSYDEYIKRTIATLFDNMEFDFYYF